MLYDWPGVYLNLTLPMPGEENLRMSTLCRIACYVHVKSYPFIRYRRKQKEREQVVHTEELKARTQSLFMCFWGERRLQIGEKVEARGDK